MSVPEPGVVVDVLSEEDARWLADAAGLATVAAAVTLLDNGADDLAVNAMLRRRGVPASRTIAAMGAAQARRRARSRWPDADQLLFTPQALQQASDPAVSSWRAQRMAGAEVWDLCAGVGGDSLALADAGANVTAVDHDAARLVLLRHNANARGLKIDIVHGDALELVPPPGALVHADPSRRHAGRRVRRLADHSPPVRALVDHLASSAGLAIVLSPAVPLDDPDLPDQAELEFVQVGADLVEAVAWCGRLRREAVASATVLPGEHHLERTGDVAPLPIGPVGSHLVEVAAAAVRARLHDDVGRLFGARRIARRRALLTTDEAPPPSPWYVARQVEAVLPPRPAAVRRWLASGHDTPIEIVVHGLDADPEQWWRALGRPPRGPTGRRVTLIRTDEGGCAVVCDARTSAAQ